MARAPPCGNYGDVDGDGVVSRNDYQLIADYTVGNVSLTPDQLARADVNGDGSVTIFDASLIYQYVTGSIDTFPVCGGTPAKHTIRFIVPSGSTVRVIK